MGSSATPAATSGSGRVLAAAAVTVLLWASAFIVIRSVGTVFDPGAMSLLRMAVGTAVLGLWAWRRGIVWPPRRSWGLLAVWGVTWFAGYNLALNTAERLIDAGTAAMVVNLAPLIVVALGGLVLREGFPRGLLVGAPVSFAGVVLIGLPTRGAQLSVLGLGLALVGAVIYAACTLLQKRLLAAVDATTLTWLGTLAGAVALLPWAPRLVADLAHAPAAATWQVLYLGVFPTAVAFTTWAYVLQRSTAGQTSATTYVVPALTIALSWLVLAEAPTPLAVVGGALCLLGVFLTRLLRR